MKRHRPTKAMILAAGLGTRLHPITHQVPKPLVEVLNIPNILHSLFLVKKAGVKDVIINLHYLPEAIENYLGNGERWGLRIAYSKEQQLLGTGGGLKKAEMFFQGEPFILANCDFVSNVDLTTAIDEHEKREALGTMVLYQNEALQSLYSQVGVDAKGHLCLLPRRQIATPHKTGIFTGIHLLSSEAFRYLREEPCGINEVLYPALMKESPDKIFGHFMKGFWRDTGDLPALFQTTIDLLTEISQGDVMLSNFMMTFGNYEEIENAVWLPKGEKLPPQVRVQGPVVLGRNLHWGDRCQVGPFVVLSDGAVIESGANLTHFIGLSSPVISSKETSQKTIQFGATKLPILR